jgi:hypothetical protein
VRAPPFESIQISNFYRSVEIQSTVIDHKLGLVVPAEDVGVVVDDLQKSMVSTESTKVHTCQASSAMEVQQRNTAVAHCIYAQKAAICQALRPSNQSLADGVDNLAFNEHVHIETQY